MPLSTLTCPECKANLKANKPVPPGKKVKCPRCATVFVTGNGAVNAATGIQAKAAPPSPPPLPPPEEDQGWEIVDDKPVEAFKVEEVLPTAPLIDYDPEVKAKDKPKPKSTRKPVPRDEEDYDDEEDEDEEDNYEEDDEEDEDEEDEDEEDEDEEDERPHQRPKRKSKSSGNQALLIILLVVGGGFLLLAAGGGAAYYWYVNRNRNHGTGNEDPLAYVPADCTVIVGVDMGALLEQPTIAQQIQQSFRRNNTAFLVDPKRDAGIEFKDLFDHMWIASKASMQQRVGGAVDTNVYILRSKVPFSQNKVRDSLKDPTVHKHQGKTYYKFNETTVFMPSDRTIIWTNAPDPTVQQIVGSDGSGSKIPADALDMIRNLEKVSVGWAVVPIESDAKNNIQAAANTAPPEFRGLVQAFSQAKAFGLSFAVAGGSVSAQMKLHCTDEKAAKQVASQLQLLWDKQFKGAGGVQMMVMLNLVPKEVKTFLQELIDSTKFTSQGSMAEASAKVSAATLQAALTQFQMMAMQQGGFQGPGGFPGVPPPGNRGRGGMRGGP